MSSFRDKHNPGKWMAKFMLSGTFHQKRGFQTKREAQQWESDERRRLAAPAGTPSASFVSVAEEYLTHCQARFQRNTWRAKATYYARFLEWCGGDLPAEQITRKHGSDFLIHLSSAVGNKNANRHIKDLSALYSWAVRHELVQRNPFSGIERLPEEPFVKYVPPAKDVDAVILAADPDETDLLETIYYTGGRISEVLSATWEDVNFERGEITLYTRKRRGGERQPDKMPLAAPLAGTLKSRWKRSGEGAGDCIFGFTKHHSRYMLYRLCDRARVRRFGYHAIRHHVASILADSGKATLRQIQQFLRHRRPTTTEHYLHDVTRDQREVVEILERGRNDTSSDTNVSES